MKKLIFILLVIPFFATAQITPAAMDSIPNAPVGASYTPSFRAFSYNGYDFVQYRLGTSSKWYTLSADKNTRAGYVGLSRQILNGYGILGGGNLSSDRTLRVDTATVQTIANLFPKGDTRYVKLAGGNSISGNQTFNGISIINNEMFFQNGNRVSFRNSDNTSQYFISNEAVSNSDIVSGLSIRHYPSIGGINIINNNIQDDSGNYFLKGNTNYTAENVSNKTDTISSSTTQYITPKAVQDYTYAKAYIDSAINNASTQNYDFTAPTTGTTTITNASLIGMYVYQVVRSGFEYDIITSGTPLGNSVLVNGSTGTITFADNFNTSQAEKGHVRYKSIADISPTAPTGLQILYADNYATAITFATGTGNKLIYVKNDEVNGGTNADGSFASSIYQYSNNVLQFYIRTGVN